MALASAIVWEVRTTGSSGNGGGFKAGASGTDYSQQDAAQVTLTVASVVNATTTKITVDAGDHTVSANDVGNIFQLAGGSATAGFYEITAVDTGANTWTLDRSVGVAGQTCPGKMGGCLDHPRRIIDDNLVGIVVVAGNIVWVQGGVTYTHNDYIWCDVNGGAITPIVVEGYTTTRGDGGSWTLQASGVVNRMIYADGKQWLFRNLILDGNSNAVYGFEVNDTKNYFDNCQASACDSNGFRITSNGLYNHFNDCYATTCGSGTSPVAHTVEDGGFYNGGDGNTYRNCRAKANLGHGFYEASAGAVTFDRCITWSNDGAGLCCTADGALTSRNCDFYANDNSGILIRGFGTLRGAVIENNLFVSNTGYGISSPDNNYTNAQWGLARFRNNAYYGNTSGARNQVPSGDDEVTLTGSPFTDPGVDNFTLNAVAGAGADCKGVGYQVYLDIGAKQSECSAAASDTPVEESCGDLTPQHLLRYRPGTLSVTDARTVAVIGGNVLKVTDPSDETEIDGVITLVDTVFDPDAKVSGAQLGKYLYLASNQQSESWQRMKPDYTLEEIARIPKGDTPTASLSTLAVQKFTDAAVFDAPTDVGGAAHATVATDYVEVTGADGAGIIYPYDNAQVWSTMKWVMVIVSPPTQSDGGGTVAISIATNAGDFEKIGEIYDTPGGKSPNVVFCPLQGVTAATLASVKRIRFVRTAGTASFLVHGVMPIPSAPQPGDVDYFVTFQQASTEAESVPSETVTVTFDSSTVTIPTFHSVRRHYSTYSDEGYASANPDTLPPAVMFNKSSPNPYPSADEYAGIATFSGTAPTGTFDTVRLWRITENGTRLVKTGSTSSGAAYSISDDAGPGVLAKPLYKATGTPAPCNAMAAVGGRLVAGGDPANPQRLNVSNFLPFAQDIDPFPKFPTLPVAASDGHSFDIAQNAAEHVLTLTEGDNALYIGTSRAMYVKTDLSPFPPIGTGDLPFQVWEKGVISRRGALWAEDRIWWASHDGIYIARNRADVEEITRDNKHIYRNWLLPDSNLMLGYQDRKLIAIRGTRYMRLDLVTGRWTRGTLAHTMRHAAMWRDPTGIRQHLWILDDCGYINRWQPGYGPDDTNRATSDAGTTIADWTYETGYDVTPRPTRVQMVFLDASGEVEVSAYKDSTVFRSKVFSVTGEHELPIASDLRGYKFRLKMTAANLVSVRRAMFERGEVKGAKGGGTAR